MGDIILLPAPAKKIKGEHIVGTAMANMTLCCRRLDQWLWVHGVMGIRPPAWIDNDRRERDVQFRQTIRHENLDKFFLVPVDSMPWWITDGGFGVSPQEIKIDQSWENWGNEIIQ